MKLTSILHRASWLLLSLFILFSCKQPETIIVNENPAPVAEESEQPDSASGPKAAFKQLNIGELNTIPTLDPLFVDNASGMRLVQLIYEGLVRFNEKGSVIPAIAKSWSVESDSLTYRFTLHNNAYYHDSDIFSTGSGRKVVAKDVKNIFERMAQINVPGDAARLFMNIEGFEPYYLEQHQVFNPAERQLNGISGISTPNDTTVVFNLENKDSYFLGKLAAPYAVIYPSETFSNTVPGSFSAVGTGPFTLSKKQGDSLFIFSRFNNYYAKKPVINRVDVIVKSREAELFKAFAKGDIHLLPEPGPQIMQSTLTDAGKLQSGYADRFTFETSPGRTYYSLNYNRDSSLPEETARSLPGLIDTTDILSDIPANFIRFKSFTKSPGNPDFSANSTINTTYSEDPFLRLILSKLSQSLKQQKVNLQMTGFRTPTRNIGLYSTTHLPLYRSESWLSSPGALAGISVQHVTLYLKSIENLRFNDFPWWINLRDVTLPGIDNL